jgi:uncharacterized protein DUF4145
LTGNLRSGLIGEVKMDCPHCGIAFHDHWDWIGIRPPTGPDPTGWTAGITRCPACSGETIRLCRYSSVENAQADTLLDFITYPRSTHRKPTPQEVPEDIKADYEEACLVLPLSNKASAALSRRCLQTILRGQGYVQRDLVKQIDALLTEPDPTKAIPTALRQTVDAIRNFGNFSAHPITDQTTLQIIAVEPNEAEWCLDILEDMFDHYYVRPAVVAVRRAALDAKLAAAGKPPSK